MGEDAAHQVVLLTGATSGIGYATARELARRGWRVLAAGHEPATSEMTAEMATCGEVVFVQNDLAEPGAAHDLVDQTLERFGRLDALVNCAGIHTLATTTQTTDEVWDRILELNLRAAFRLTREAIPVMVRTGGGTVVNVASEAGIVAVPGQVAYNVSKAGLIMLTRSIAVDHAAEGIRAVSVCPGTTMTPLVRAAIDSAPDPEAHERRLADARPAGRLGRPEEIAAAIAFVLSGDVAYMTGSELVIDGGYTAR